MSPGLRDDMEVGSSSDGEIRQASSPLGGKFLVMASTVLFLAAFMLGACAALLFQSSLHSSPHTRLRALGTTAQLGEAPEAPAAPVLPGLGVTGLPGNPKLYGKIPEKTIWFYYDKGFDPMPSRIVDLCIQSFCANNPDWNFEFVSDSNLLDYVSADMLPSAFWTWHQPANKKDMVMANLLALYGGVAVDSTIINFKSLNGLWQKMLQDGADAVIYWYRLVEPWGAPDSAAVWSFMARRDTGIFRRYAQDIKANFGDVLDVSQAGGNPYLAFGSGSLEPIMVEVNASLPLCMNDPTLTEYNKQRCATSAAKYHAARNGNLNNTKVILLDPNDRHSGPQLNIWKPLCINMAGDCPTPTRQNSAGLWQEYEDRKSNPYFTMIKLFARGGTFAQTHPELLLQKNMEENIFSEWFKAAGLEPDQPSRCKAKMERQETN